VSDGLIWDDLPANCRVEPGRPLECSSKLFVFNPQRKDADVKVTFYHVDRPPTSVRLHVRAGEIEMLEVAALPEVPHGQAFWIELESTVPVLPQACHEDFTFWDPVPDAMVAVSPYPGPLRDETSWVFPDCFQGGPKSWHERETATILNPGKRPVKVRVRYLLRTRELGAEEEITVPGQRVVQLDVWEREPRLLGTQAGPLVKIAAEYAMRIDATGPVIAQATRRARWRNRPSVVGAKSSMAVPLREGPYGLWYYPGGAIIDRGILPRGKNCDVTWNLLFTNNLDERKEGHAAVTFHRADGSTTRAELPKIRPLKSDLQWLHLEPWLGPHTVVNEPYAMTVTADGPVVPEVCGAEFEMWSQICPGAMTGVNFYPGPLSNERTWWLGIGRAGGSDEHNVEWAQSYHLFNPGARAVRVRLCFLGLGPEGKAPSRSVEIPRGGVALVESAEVEGLPLHRPFAARADGDAPFVAQVFGRTFTRGLAHTRAMYSFMGVPMKLAAGR
jgi:hypothetical protein